MGGFVFAWAAGQAIVIYRSVRDQGGPPWPGQMIMSSVIYAILAAISQAGQGGRQVALYTAWGLNIAAYLNLYNITYAPGTPATGSNGAWWKAITDTAGGAWSQTQLWPSGNCQPGAGTATGGGGGVSADASTSTASGGSTPAKTTKTAQQAASASPQPAS